MNTPLAILPVHMDLPVSGDQPASPPPHGSGSIDSPKLVSPETTNHLTEPPADEPRNQAPRMTRRSLAGLLGLMGLGALGVPVQAVAADVLPACTMRIHLIFDEQPRQSVALTAQVVQTRDGWQLQGLLSPVTEEVVMIPLDPTRSGEFTRLLTAALASEVPDPELALTTNLGDWQSTLA